MSISVSNGEVLTVTADPGSYGTVWSGNHQWSVGAKSPLRLGPGQYRIETIKGSVSHSVASAAVAALEATLPRATAIVSAAANIAGAVVLKDKFARLADRTKAVPAALSQRADDALAKWDAVEAKGATTFDTLGQVVADAEQGVQAAEDALNQLTNGVNQ